MKSSVVPAGVMTLLAFAKTAISTDARTPSLPLKLEFPSLHEVQSFHLPLQKVQQLKGPRKETFRFTEGIPEVPMSYHRAFGFPNVEVQFEIPSTIPSDTANVIRQEPSGNTFHLSDIEMPALTTVFESEKEFPISGASSSMQHPSSETNMAVPLFALFGNVVPQTNSLLRGFHDSSLFENTASPSAVRTPLDVESLPDGGRVGDLLTNLDFLGNFDIAKNLKESVQVLNLTPQTEEALTPESLTPESLHDVAQKTPHLSHLSRVERSFLIRFLEREVSEKRYVVRRLPSAAARMVLVRVLLLRATYLSFLSLPEMKLHFRVILRIMNRIARLLDDDAGLTLPEVFESVVDFVGPPTARSASRVESVLAEVAVGLENPT